MNQEYFNKILPLIIEQELPDIVKDYKIEADLAGREIEQTLQNFLPLWQKLGQSQPDFKELQRYKEYKDLVKKIRKQIYFNLRQYQQDQQAFLDLLNQIQEEVDSAKLKQLFDQSLSLHVSTKERLPFYERFRQFLQKYLLATNLVLDLGCGLDPLMCADLQYQQLVAVDKDPKAIQVLDLYKQKLQKNNWQVVNTDLNQFNQEDYLNNKQQFDLTLMLKLIPVVARQDRQLLDKLAQIKTKKLLITASKQAMTKNQDIYHREKQVLEQFIEKTGKKVVDELDLENEFGYLLQG